MFNFLKKMFFKKRSSELKDLTFDMSAQTKIRMSQIKDLIIGLEHLTVEVKNGLDYLKPTYVRVHKSIAQNIVGFTWTKLKYENITNDLELEFDTTTSRFITKEKGRYIINTTLELDAVTSTQQVCVAIYLNGVKHSELYDIYIPRKILSLSITELIEMNANDYIELYVWSDNDFIINSGENKSFLQITQAR